MTAHWQVHPVGVQWQDPPRSEPSSCVQRRRQGFDPTQLAVGPVVVGFPNVWDDGHPRCRPTVMIAELMTRLLGQPSGPGLGDIPDKIRRPS